jgi:HAE1 family hydrophobic/amphiphilic exporter-1
MKFSLPRFAINRPVTISMLFITLLGFGGLAAVRIPVEFMPPMDLPFLGVFIPYPGATPAQVEQEIAIPAEGEFKTLPSLSQVYTNSNDGGCFVSLEFDWGMDMTDALAEVRDRIEQLRLTLPTEADRIFMRHFSLESIPIMSFGLSSEENFDVFADRVDREILPKLLRLDGVAEIQVHGVRQKNIMVDIDQQALLSRNVSLYNLISTVSTGNVDEGVGQLLDGDKKYHLRAEAPLASIYEYAELPLGGGVRLKEVATGDYRAPDDEWHFSIDGKKELFFSVTKEAEANTAATTARLVEELDRILADPEFSKTTHLFTFFNQGDIINGALNSLKKASMYGGLMALLVLLAFLRRLRPTVLVALAIPASLVSALVMMYALGINLNLITMMSMIIAVGMVVDNAIVVIENIYRYQEMGYDRKESARLGAENVSLAIVAATCTTAVVFVPVFYANGGQMNIFMKQFALPVTIALMSSLVLALTIIPLAVSRFRKYEKSPMSRLRKSGAPASDAPPSKVRHVLGWLNVVKHARNSYMFFLKNGMRHRLVSVLVVAGIIALTIQLPMRKMGFQQMPSADRRQVEVSVKLDVNYDLAMADGVFDSIEGLLEERKEELGIKHIFKNYSARGGDFSLYLLQDKDMPSSFVEFPYSSEEVMDILWYLLPERSPGAEFFIATDSNSRGGGGGQSKVSVRMEGEDTQVLDGYAMRFMEILETMPGISGVRKSTERADQEIRLNIDDELAGVAGIPPMQIAQTVGFALMGTELSRVKSGTREIVVRAQFEEEDRKNSANLDNIMMMGSNGEMITLNQLVTKTKAETPQVIQRRNGKNFVYVTASSASKDMSTVNAQMRQAVDTFQLPTGYNIAMGDELRQIQEDQSNFFSILIMAVLLIYIVMAALFESYLLPLSILTTVPMAFMGVVWLMWVTGTPMDTIAFIGCILMVGVVVNNGIVIVDHINALRKTGMDRYEAIIQGGRDRLRPVLMTALTTILGALPLAIGGRLGQPAAVSLGMSMIGGLMAGTVLTLFVVPLFYSFVDDAQKWISSYAGELFPKTSKIGGAAKG